MGLSVVCWITTVMLLTERPGSCQQIVIQAAGNKRFSKLWQTIMGAVKASERSDCKCLVIDVAVR